MSLENQDKHEILELAPDICPYYLLAPLVLLGPKVKESHKHLILHTADLHARSSLESPEIQELDLLMAFLYYFQRKPTKYDDPLLVPFSDIQRLIPEFSSERISQSLQRLLRTSFSYEFHNPEKSIGQCYYSRGIFNLFAGVVQDGSGDPSQSPPLLEIHFNLDLAKAMSLSRKITWNQYWNLPDRKSKSLFFFLIFAYHNYPFARLNLASLSKILCIKRKNKQQEIMKIVQPIMESGIVVRLEFNKNGNDEYEVLFEFNT